MNINDAMKARRALVTLLRHPEEWPTHFAFHWGTPSAKIFRGYTYGCAKVLAQEAGITREVYGHELDLTLDDYNTIFFHLQDRTPAAIANNLEQTIPVHEMLL